MEMDIFQKVYFRKTLYWHRNLSNLPKLTISWLLFLGEVSFWNTLIKKSSEVRKMKAAMALEGYECGRSRKVVWEEAGRASWGGRQASPGDKFP